MIFLSLLLRNQKLIAMGFGALSFPVGCHQNIDTFSEPELEKITRLRKVNRRTFLSIKIKMDLGLIEIAMTIIP